MWSTLAEQIRLKLASVASDMGAIYKYQIDVKNDADTIAKLSYNDAGIKRLRVWLIGREGVDNRDFATQQQIQVSRAFILTFHQVDESANSELSFQDRLDDVLTMLNTNISLGQSVLVAEPWQIEQIGFEMFAERLCHTAKLTCRIHELKNYNYI